LIPENKFLKPMIKMKRTIKIILLYFLITGLQMPSIFGQSLEVDVSTKAYLKKFRDDYSKSLVTNKPDLLKSYFADTIRLMPTFQKTVFGKVNALLYFKSLTNRFTIHSYTRNEVEILDLGKQVLEIGEIKMRMALKSSGKEFDIAAKYLNLWVKAKNGEPKLLTEAWNGDHYYSELHDHLRFEDIPSIHIALQPNVLVTNDIQFELAALNRLLDATITEHDGRMWSLYYADDAKLMASYYPINSGRKAIDEYIQKHIKELPTFQELEIRNDRIDDLGNYIVEYASHIASWKNGDRSGVGLGKNIRIWRREQNHALKLFRSISMYD
jgi:ketosteroid isomerase-like protein